MSLRPKLAFTKMSGLFDNEAPFTKESFAPAVVAHLRSNKFPGTPIEWLEITSQEGAQGGMIVKRVDPFEATGYLAFKSEQEYSDWLQSSLYEPSQDEIEEAAGRGSRT